LKHPPVRTQPFLTISVSPHAASFEPGIDYVVTKIPRFAFEKFPQADPTLTTQMKSVGEAMAIGRTFKESLQKCLRSLEIGRSGLGGDGKPWRIGTEVYGDRDILPPDVIMALVVDVDARDRLSDGQQGAVPRESSTRNDSPHYDCPPCW
jgi:hypothetical protein